MKRGLTHCCKQAARGRADMAEAWHRAEVKQAARGSADRAEMWSRAEVKQAARGRANMAEAWHRAEWPGGRADKE